MADKEYIRPPLRSDFPSLTDTGYKYLLELANNINQIYTDAVLVDGSNEMTGNLRYETALIWKCFKIPSYNIATGASGATETPPDANTSGGFNLDADGEYLYTTGSV